MPIDRLLLHPPTADRPLHQPTIRPLLRMRREEKACEPVASWGVSSKSLQTWQRSAASRGSKEASGVWSQSVESGMSKPPQLLSMVCAIGEFWSGKFLEASAEVRAHACT